MSTCTVNAIAKLLNLKERRVQVLAQQGIIPKAQHGKYNIVGCIVGYNKYMNNRTARTEDTTLKVNKARTRLLEAQADKAEMELKALSKDYMPVTQVERDWSGMLLTFRARILAIPYRAATLLTGAKEFHEIEQVLKKLLHEALDELSNYDPCAIVAEAIAELAETELAGDTTAEIADASTSTDQVTATVTSSTSTEDQK
jgi:phage terminase Nu1 subunit (DNA packaging protein)